MKKLSMLFAALLLAGGGVMFTGCSDNDKEQTGEITITTDPKSPITLDAGENEFQVNVTVTGVSTWSVAAASGQDWCTADKGNFQNRFYITTPANDTGEERSTTVTITAGDKTLPLTVTQPVPVGAAIYVGTKDQYLGTWNIKAPYFFEEGTSNITITIAEGPDVDVPMQDGSTQKFDGLTISGWSASGVGAALPATAFFYPAQDDGTGFIVLKATMNVGTFDGHAMDFKGLSVASDGQSVYAFSGDYFIVDGFFADEQATTMIWGPEEAQTSDGTKYTLYTGCYTFDGSDGWDMIDNKDAFAVILDATTTTRVGGTSAVNATAYKAKATRSVEKKYQNLVTAVKIR